MSGPTHCLLRARRDELAQALAFVEAFCMRHGVALADQMRMTLAVEELFTNTVMHGHGGDSDAPVRVALDVDAQHLTLRYEDQAPPFDPVQYLRESAPDPATLVTDREPGGYGLPLLAEMAARLDYLHVDGLNQIVLVLARSD